LLTPTPVDPAPFDDVLSRTAGSVGRLLSTSCAGAPMAGSGFVVDARHVLTASHVVGGARQVSLRLGGAAPVLADVVGIDPVTDTALVRTSEDLPASPLALAGPDETAPGTAVGVLGYPLGDASLRTALTRITSVTESAVVNDHPTQNLVVVDETLRLGMSGGPALDAEGRVRGMVVAQIPGRGGRDSTSPVALAVPTRTLAGSLAGWQAAPTPAAAACAGEHERATSGGPDLITAAGVDAELAHTLWLLGSSLNAGQFPSAWGMLTEHQQWWEGDLARWTVANSELPWARIEVEETTRDGERATAKARVRTTWQDGRCREQQVGYGFRLVAGIWLIDTIDTGVASGCG
jgi:hypothetical protein